MILVTVGTQLPFDRLVRAVDSWCAASGRRDVFGQICDPGPRGYRPTQFEWKPFIAPRELNEFCARAELIIAHAGMGSIISALQQAKPIVIMPRQAALGEHRNDHQQATAVRFANRPGLFVARDEVELPSVLDRAISPGDQSFSALNSYAAPSLIHALRRYLATGEVTQNSVPDELDELGLI